MKKITAILIVITSLIMLGNRAEATTIFSDGFESGDFTAWTSTSQTSGTTLAVTSTYAHHGIYSAYGETGTISGTVDLCSKTITAAQTVYVRLTVKPITAPSYAGVTNAVYYINLGGSAGTNVSLGMSSTRALTLLYYDGAWNFKTSATLLTLGTPCQLELYFYSHATQGKVYVWKDGVAITDLTVDPNTRSNLVTSVRTGIMSYAGSTFYSGGTNVKTYWDCVVAADAYIGPEVTASISNAQINNAQIK